MDERRCATTGTQPTLVDFLFFVYAVAGSLGSRRWSSLAKWRLREFNELPHYIQHRLDASYEAAVKYVGQFPSPMVSQVRADVVALGSVYLLDTCLPLVTAAMCQVHGSVPVAHGQPGGCCTSGWTWLQLARACD
jgi:hypothetical protein